MDPDLKTNYHRHKERRDALAQQRYTSPYRLLRKTFSVVSRAMGHQTYIFDF